VGVSGAGNGAGNGNGTGNGSGQGTRAGEGAGGSGSPPAPEKVRDLAEACVRFVERSLGVKLDYEPETLPLLDHYLAAARAAAGERPEAGMLVAHAAGAYLGEVVRRRYPSWWRAEADDPLAWRIELETVYLSFSPVELMADALHRRGDAEASEGLTLEDEDRQAIAERLAELGPVAEDEFYAPSTRLEVIDIAVDAIRARRLGAGEPAEVRLRPEDYDPTPS
jgi:catechol 2,3-dioxygenase-like lactoylglutathione lyase family enzyme